MYRAKDEGRGRYHLWNDDSEPIIGRGRDSTGSG